MSDLAERFRREGMADAVVILVAKRIHPNTTAEEWGRALGLQQHEVIAAIARFRAEHTPGGATRPTKLRVVDGRKPHGNAGRRIPSLAERRARDERIRQMRVEGEMLQAIAETVGLTVSRVQQILGGA